MGAAADTASSVLVSSGRRSAGSEQGERTGWNVAENPERKHGDSECGGLARGEARRAPPRSADHRGEPGKIPPRHERDEHERERVHVQRAQWITNHQSVHHARCAATRAVEPGHCPKRTEDRPTGGVDDSDCHTRAKTDGTCDDRSEERTRNGWRFDGRGGRRHGPNPMIDRSRSLHGAERTSAGPVPRGHDTASAATSNHAVIVTSSFDDRRP